MVNEEFDWSDEQSVVQHSVQGVAAYINTHGQVVIRQQRDWDDDDDTWIVLHPDSALRLSDRLKALAIEAKATS